MRNPLASLRRLWRVALHSQLLPVLESGDDPLIGGQAVIEGVMMRAPHSYCIAVRRPNGEVISQRETIRRLPEVNRIWGWPFVRGLATLGQAMSLGFRALQFSAAHAMPESEQSAPDSGEKKSAEIPGWVMAGHVLFSLGFFLFLYKFVPLWLTSQLQEQVTWLQDRFTFSLVDGLVRLGIFLLFLAVISRMKDIRRVFQYHGAEHKVVFNYESGQPVDVNTSQSFTTFHPRCGTSFLMVVMIISIFVYALAPAETFAGKMLARVVLLPVITGISYEVIRLASRRGRKLLAWFVAPGLWLQRITTKDPADDQVAVSIHALEGAMALEKEQQGELVVA